MQISSSLWKCQHSNIVASVLLLMHRVRIKVPLHFVSLALLNADRFSNSFTGILCNSKATIKYFTSKMFVLNRRAPALSEANCHSRLIRLMLTSFCFTDEKMFTVEKHRTTDCKHASAATRKTSRNSACTHDHKWSTVHQFDTCGSAVKLTEDYYCTVMLLQQFLPAVYTSDLGRVFTFQHDTGRADVQSFFLPLKPRLHDTTGCQAGWTTRLTTNCIV